MKRIELTRGKFAIVDDSDFDELSKFKWHAMAHHSGIWYAKRSVSINNKRGAILMHRQILPDCKIVDHKNGDGLDNRRLNLRSADASISNRNRTSLGSSKYVGVSKYKRGASKKKWVARIKINGKVIWLGTYEYEIDAAKAYLNGAKKYGVLDYVRNNVLL